MQAVRTKHHAYEQKEEGRPLFVFNVTMQNHGGYDQTYTNFSPGISVDGVNSISVSQYFSLISCRIRH